MSENHEKNDALFLEIFRSHLEYSRFHEELREASTRIVLLIAGGLFAFIFSPHAEAEMRWMVALAIVALGFIGFLLSAAHSAKQKEHYDQGSVYFRAAAKNTEARKEVYKEAQLARDSARDASGVGFAGMRLRIGVLWKLINLLIVFGGVAVLFFL